MTTATHKFDKEDSTSKEHSVVVKNLTGPFPGLHFVRQNSVVIDTTHGLIQLPDFTFPAKNAGNEAGAKPQPVFIQDSKTVPRMKTKTKIAFVDHPSEWYTTGTVTPLGNFPEVTNLLIRHLISTIIVKKTSVRNINAMEAAF